MALFAILPLFSKAQEAKELQEETLLDIQINSISDIVDTQLENVSVMNTNYLYNKDGKPNTIHSWWITVGDDAFKQLGYLEDPETKECLRHETSSGDVQLDLNTVMKKAYKEDDGTKAFALVQELGGTFIDIHVNILFEDASRGGGEVQRELTVQADKTGDIDLHGEEGKIIAKPGQGGKGATPQATPAKAVPVARKPGGETTNIPIRMVNNPDSRNNRSTPTKRHQELVTENEHVKKEDKSNTVPIQKESTRKVDIGAAKAAIMKDWEKLQDWQAGEDVSLKLMADYIQALKGCGEAIEGLPDWGNMTAILSNCSADAEKKGMLNKAQEILGTLAGCNSWDEYLRRGDDGR